MAAKDKTVYVCASCGHEAPRWLGRCPSCNNFNTYEEQVKKKGASTAKATYKPTQSTAKRLNALDVDGYQHKIKTGIAELDNVLTGGIVPGSLTLIGGEPGIGKSTLLLQICKEIRLSRPILYISGEESAQQVHLRSRRLIGDDEFDNEVYIHAETSMEAIEQEINALKPALLIIDSIQTCALEELPSAMGSIVQVRECTAALMRLAKSMGMAIIIVGHVTKEGNIAGPRMLEHMVDTVLYFEGERRASYRLVRAVKNRFGATNEVGIFEMVQKGLIAIDNPSEYMLSGRPLNVPGSVVTAAMEGSRPMLSEVQALVAKSSTNMPRRVANGIDYNRLHMLLAMMEKRTGIRLGEKDVFVNVAGGMKLNEPSADLAIVAAVASSEKNSPIDPFTLIFGETGLAGEVRATPASERRLEEAAKLGFKAAIIPATNLKGNKGKIKLYGAAGINEMLELLL